MTFRQIDSFGDVRVDGGNLTRARLIRVEEFLFAAFTEADPTVPMLFAITAEPTVRGRNLSVETIGGGLLEFRRASCGCQTPRSLRGVRSSFTKYIQPAEETEPADA